MRPALFGAVRGRAMRGRMTRVLIQNRVQRDFAMVPNGIWRADLPSAAKCAAAYLFSLRDGAMPFVREMELALGMGRDARRKAFAALEAFGFLRWVYVRDGSGVIVAKTLVLEADVFTLAPESQAVGEKHLAPENPAGGKSTPVKVDSHLCIDGKSGDTLREEKTKGAAVAKSRPIAQRKAVRLAPSVQNGDTERLSAFQRASIFADRSVLIGERLVAAGSAEMQALRHSLRSLGNENQSQAAKGALHV